MTKKAIKKYCYMKWLASPQTWNHYQAARLLEKKLLAKYNLS
jgi:hypothetical protein